MYDIRARANALCSGFRYVVGNGKTYGANGLVTRVENTPVDRLLNFGQVVLKVRNLSISGTTPETATFEWVEFDVEASWPSAYKPADFRFVK